MIVTFGSRTYFETTRWQNPPTGNGYRTLQSVCTGSPHEKTIEIRDDVAFFQAVRGVLAKPTATEEARSEATDQAIKQLISRAVISEGVIDIFAAAGLEKPDVSILSDEFLVEVRDFAA